MTLNRLTVSFAVALAAVGLCAAKAPDTLAVRKGLTLEQLKADGDTCVAEGKAAEKGKDFASAAYLGDGSPAAAAAGGFLKGMGDMERFFAGYRACLRRVGYSLVPLTPEQKREYGALKREQRAQYVVDFSARATADE